MTIHDNHNSPATGKATILVRQKAGKLGTTANVDSGVAAKRDVQK